jgi:hypothetical protein
MIGRDDLEDLTIELVDAGACPALPLYRAGTIKRTVPGEARNDVR